MPEENVKVAVRVRPFNRRENERNATVIIDMNGSTTEITDPAGGETPKKFTFDYSYWSHDGCKDDGTGYYGPDTSHPNGKKFADQKKVFNDLGVGVLTNAWEGYNSTLFAYGQTGSGKSWSVVGYGINAGIVPQLCEMVFNQIDEKKAAGPEVEFEVTFSMLEIYNENVRDLLGGGGRKSALKVRQHPKMGFYAEGLKVVPVGSYIEIESKMEEGTRNRTVAATNMNATSSRAHTIVGITLTQKSKNAAGEETTKSSVVNLVDLAGSERAESTGATGDRLKEGAAINQSLSSLGNCIAALADRSSGKDTRVPFRDSVLTKLLKNALGGNSRTIMIAALSPADINYDETLSTLRYADRAKQIKCSAKVNEDPTAQLIRDLQEENEKLKAMMATGKMEMIPGEGDDEDLTEEEKAQMKKELEEEYKSRLDKNQQEMEEMKKTFEERLKEAEVTGVAGEDKSVILEKKKTIPHLYNLNMDPQLTGYIIHFIDGPQKTMGSSKEGVDIVLGGPSIAATHCTIQEEGGKFSITPAEANIRLTRNGKSVAAKHDLKHNDRLIFGTTQYFCFCNPKERDASGQKYPDVSFEMAQEEIAKKSGFDMSGENKSKEDTLIQRDLLELLPAIEEANSISEDLDKKLKFELMIVSPEARGELSGRTEVMIKVTDLVTKHEWIWPRQKFLNRKYVMQEMYQDYVEDGVLDHPPESDPFVEDYNADYHIGSVKLWLQSMAYMIETKEQLEVTDFRGQDVGLLNVEVIPCSKTGKEYKEEDDVFVDQPQDLCGKDVFFKVKITSARGLPAKFNDIYAKYKVYVDEQFNQTNVVKNTSNPDWKHEKQFSYPTATQQFVDYVKDSAIMIQIWGKQKEPKTKRNVNTKAEMLTLAMTKGQSHTTNTNVKKFDAEKVKYMMEVTMLKKRQEKMELKLNYMRRMLEMAEEKKKKKLKTDLVKDLYHASTADDAERCLKKIMEEQDDDDSDGSDSESDDEKKKKLPEKEEKKQERKKSIDSNKGKSPRPTDTPRSQKKESSLCVLL